eukprot:360291-Chlamydomonas_euryale.AAC.9
MCAVSARKHGFPSERRPRPRLADRPSAASRHALSWPQVEAYTQQSEGGPRIVGYYQADARMQAADIGPISRRLADKLVDRYSRAVLLLLDNKKLQAFVKGGAAHPFDLFDHENKSWRREPAERVAIAGGTAMLREGFSAALASSSHRMLVDFDDHLDDVGNDWCNPGLENMGKMQLPGQLRLQYSLGCAALALLSLCLGLPDFH